MALTKDGFKRKTYDELLSDMSAKAQEYFGADANVSERAVLGILLRIMAWFLALAWMAIEQVYHGSYRKTAEGHQLDMLLPAAGITRNLEDYAYGEVTLNGTPGHTVASGFLVSSANIIFETIDDCVLDASGSGTVAIVCTEIGPIGNVPAGAITEIVETDADVTSVVNMAKTDGGREKETDAEARARADITVEGMGSSTPAAIRTALLKVNGVRAAQVIDNYGDVTDAYGTPSRAFQSFVLGGVDTDIATAILNAKAGGIQPYGTTYVTVNDLSGNPQLVGFTRATEVNLYAKAIISTNNEFEANGVNQVKNTLVKYIGGADTAAQLYAGLNMGEKVVLAKAMAQILAVNGVTDVDLSLSTDDITYTEANVVVNVYEVAQIDATNIEVTISV